MNFRKKNKTSVDILVILAVFCVFTLTALFVVLFGAKVYQSNVDGINGSFNQRTSYLYIREKIKSHNRADAISITDDGTMIILTQPLGAKNFNTYLYTADGNLCEYTAAANAPFNSNYGDAVLPLNGLKIEAVKDNLLKISLTTDNNETDEFYINVIGVKEVPNAN